MALPLLNAFRRDANEDFLGKLFDAAMDECEECANEVWDRFGYRAVAEPVDSMDVTESPRLCDVK